MLIREPNGDKMLIVLELPDDFEQQYTKDRFKYSLERIQCDIVKASGLSWQYEFVEALIKGFAESKMIKEAK